MRTARSLLLIMLLASPFVAGCDDAGSEADATHDSSDTGSGDTVTDATDGSADAPEGGSGTVEGDAADTDADSAADTADDDAWIASCPEPPPGDQPRAGRWSLSLFHFNIQYVAGGTTGFAEIAANAPASARLLDMSEQETEDRIITESMVPLLEILERHPTLALTFELQGYAVDVIRERHPDVLARMRRLVENRQLELASIHWSDQFFLAFGRRDMDRSWEMTQASFAAADLPLSPVVFTQEGQFGPGFAAWLAAKRPNAIMVIPSNLSRFYAQSFADAPLLRYGDLTAILPRGFGSETVERNFSFFDDGELLATANLNPYVGRAFARNAASIRTYENELRCAERNGYRVGRIEDYVEALRDAGVTPVEHPPLLDGTWQPNSTRGPLRWMGGAGDLWSKHERDLEVLRSCVQARYQVLELETLLNNPGAATADAIASARQALDASWRDLLWGEVSDARGVNPWHGEVEYGLGHCSAAESRAESASSALALSGYAGRTGLEIDTAAGTVTEVAQPFTAEVSAVAPPFAVELDDGGRGATANWHQTIDREGAEIFILTILWPALPEAVARFESCIGGDPTRRWACVQDPIAMEVRLPRSPGSIELRPALSDALLRTTEAGFDLQPNAASDAAWVPVASGLIGLGNGWYAVKEVASTHVAVGWPAGAPANSWVRLRDETRQPFEATTWEIRFTRDEAAANRLAEANESPRLWRAIAP